MGCSRDRPATCFNGATGSHPWKSNTSSATHLVRGSLQWGHGLSPVEMATRAPIKLLPLSLQWGHGLSPVEMGSIISCQARLISLQWGHGLSPVEIGRRGGPAAQCGPRFNGATGSHPWKCLAMRSLPSRRHPASMGPRALTRGNLEASCRRCNQSYRFNGATGSHPWK